VRDGRLLGLAAGLFVGTTLLAGCGAGDDALISGVSTPGNHGLHGTYLVDPYVVPDLALTGTGNQPVTLSEQPAPLKVVFFGYTHCPDICQIVMSTIASAITRLGAEERAQVPVTFVTTDPARDTPAALRTYLDRFNPDFDGLTGPLRTIEDLAAPLHVYVEKGQKLSSGGYEVGHSTYVFAVVGAGVKVIWSSTTSPAEMASDIHTLLAKEPT
jgi:protein SCO1/2